VQLLVLSSTSHLILAALQVRTVQRGSLLPIAFPTSLERICVCTSLDVVQGHCCHTGQIAVQWFLPVLTRRLQQRLQKQCYRALYLVLAIGNVIGGALLCAPRINAHLALQDVQNFRRFLMLLPVLRYMLRKLAEHSTSLELLLQRMRHQSFCECRTTATKMEQNAKKTSSESL